MSGAIEIERLSYIYPDGSNALHNVSFSVVEGERISIVGPNGAGKSTLLLLLAGLREPTGGRIKVLEVEMGGKAAEGVRGKIGLVFQDPDDQIFMPTVEEDVAFGPTNLGVPGDEIDRRVASVMSTTGLKGFEGRAPHHLSAGEKKRVAIAGVLAMAPRIILLDEPTAGLDPRGKADIMDLIKKLDGTIILVTHDMDLALDFCDRVILLKRSVLFDGKSRDLFDNKALIESADLAQPRLMQLAMILREEGILGKDDFPRSMNELRSDLARNRRR
ncbi:MAG TPA: ABC transporter ATP-binding protein [Thermoplasmata archaeon]|nr:ABC transporter ATP-binding protein [Thermoplasmata archaeon]